MDSTKKIDPLSRAFETIRRLKAQLDEQGANQPLAIVGVGMRFPGGIEDLDGYWDALAHGRDLVRPMQDSRLAPFEQEWKSLPRRGGFLPDVLGFDAAFFGISPREARAMDPQQRLLLEVAWEALEDSALPPASLGKGRTGMYVGITGQDYRDWMRGEPDAYWTTGNGHCFAAGRIAYCLGFTGPAVAVDTACSSSLVAVHLASQALRRGECDVALAGGVNLVLSPRSTRLIEQTRSLAPDGLCKAFDARANGFTRGEGCGVVVLKRLDHALRDNDRIHAVVHGSAINQDGRSTGFTAPNVLSQVALIEAALADAGLTAEDIGLVEAHGTGTSLGDPIETDALVGALGRRNGSRPVYVGSVKANFGHLEAAAGVAGLIKAALCTSRRRVPPLVHFRTLNPRIDLAGSDLRFPRELALWADASCGQYAGVSSFGMSGTNAHVIVGPHTIEGTERAEVDVAGFDVSAKTPDALRALAARYADALAGMDAGGYAAFAYTCSAGRARHPATARVRACSASEAVQGLKALAEGSSHASVTLDVDRADAEPLSPLPRAVVSLPAYPWERQTYAPEGHEIRGPATDTATATASRVDENTGSKNTGLYELAFEPLALQEGLSADRRYLLAGDDTPWIVECARQLGRAGVHFTVLTPERPEGVDVGTWRRLPQDDSQWDTALQAQASPFDVLLAYRDHSLPDVAGDAALVRDGAALCTHITGAVRSVARVAGEAPCRAFALTRGTRALCGDDVLANDHGLIHGLAPALGLEFPRHWAGVIDRAADADLATETHTVVALTQQVAAGEDVLAVRQGQAFAGRLRSAAADFRPELPVRNDASYLVTGGVGGIGREVARFLVRGGARHLVLVGRREREQLADEECSLLQDLESQGVTVHYVSADCDDAGALGEAFRVLRELPPLRGIVHGAGQLAPHPLTTIDANGFAKALRGKFSGAVWLHLLSRDTELDFFLPLSSVSSVWGTDGYGAYGAANGGVDALATARRAAGLPAVSVQYGPWGLNGMADEASREVFARMGVSSLEPRAGCAALTASAGSPQLLACDADWQRFVGVMESHRPRALFTELVQPSNAHNAGSEAPTTDAVAELMALPEGARTDRVRTHVAREVATILGHAHVEELRRDDGFFDQGLDSIMAVDLARVLGEQLCVTLKVSDIFSHPTVNELADAVLAKVSNRPQTSRSPSRPATRPAPTGGPVPSDSVVTLGASGLHEPIAIVGMAGRFPGADSIDEFWDLLREGRDAVSQVPSDRWDAASMYDSDPLALGKVSTDQGGFLGNVRRFDAGFFKLPAREADSLDPQHRLLLEVAWHALEHGAIDPRSLKGSKTGVFVGISNSDYARLLDQGGVDQLDAYYATGTALNAAAGRLAFLLGLSGPALAVDTACSSSLVGLHLAVRSLRSGESDCVLAGGVNVLADPSTSVAVSRAHMLSPDGRCKTFSAEANGFVRAEGCGVLVLKRLPDARRDGNRVLGVIRGSAVNQDGASAGLTVPSGKAQQAVIRAALEDAGVEPAAVSYLEAHGTGTSLGDPIELEAAWGALGEGRKPGEPLQVGSVKSNIGHAESAAGMASVIKSVLALQHAQLPASIHCQDLNPNVSWDEMNVRVVDAMTPWRRGKGPRTSGVSGFGFSGTNAHVVLSEAPEPAAQGEERSYEGPVLLPLSAPDTESLQRVRDAWLASIQAADDDALVDLAFTAAAGRAQLPVRRAVVGSSREQLLKALRRDGTGEARTRPPRVAFLFSGQGSQYFGMGRELYETEPAFREVIDACDRILADKLGASLLDLMFYGDDEERILQTRFTQPCLVALELALVNLWASWGVTPCALMGHSVGEVAAAIHAGVLSFEAGLTLIAERARLMQETEKGAMLAIAATLEQVETLLEGRELDVAAINGPESVVVAGAPTEIDALAAHLKENGVVGRPLVVSHAFHSRLMEPIMGELRQAISRFSFGAPKLPLIANLTGQVAVADQYDADYWCQHVRNPVQFHAGGHALLGLDVDFVLEVGPDRTLVNLLTAAELLPAGGGMPSLRRGTQARPNLFNAVKQLFELGQDVDWPAVLAATGGRFVQAPLYPFAGADHWTAVRPQARAAAAAELAPRSHWGRELFSPALRGRVFAFERTADFPAYLGDHRLYGTVVTPAASHLATTLSAVGREGSNVVIHDLICPRALVIKDDERYDVQLVVNEEQAGQKLSVQSLIDAERNTWQTHIEARLVEASGTAACPPELPDRQAFIDSAERHVSGADFYRYFRDRGYTLGPSFCWIGDIWIRGEEALVRYTQPVLPDAVTDYELYPGLIDSCFQSVAGFEVQDACDEAPALAIPFAASELSFHGRPRPGEDLWGAVRVLKAEALPNDRCRVETANLHLFTEQYQSLFVASEFRVRHAPRAVLERSLRSGIQQAYVPKWVEHALEAPTTAESAATVALLTDVPSEGLDAEVLERRQALIRSLASHFESLGQVVRLVDSTQLSAECDLIVDARFALPDARAPLASAALTSVRALAESLRRAPLEVPYVLWTQDGADAAPTRESLWGMCAALEAEQARTLIRLSVTPDAAPDLAPRWLLRGCQAGFDEVRLRVDAQGAQALRLQAAESELQSRSWQGSVLITGGLGALGLSVATTVAAAGAPAVALMGRSEPDASALAVIEELKKAGTHVEVVRGDVTSVEDCARAVRAIAHHAPLAGVFHLAGANRDRAFDALEPADFEAAFAAKCQGAEALADATRDMKLQSFVVFSSVASALGSAGQVNYAAANGLLDGLALLLRERGVPAVSVNWGPWVPNAKGGMAATEAVRRASARVGLRALSDEEAAPLVQLASEASLARFIAVAADFERYAEHLDGHPRARLVASLVERSRRDKKHGEQSERPRGYLRDGLQDVQADSREDDLREALRKLVGEVLGDDAYVDDHAGFAELGVDSIMAIDLRSKMAHALDMDFPATVAIDYPNVGAMARYATQALFPDAAPTDNVEMPNADAAPLSEDLRPELPNELDELSFEQLMNAVQRDIATGQ